MPNSSEVKRRSADGSGVPMRVGELPHQITKGPVGRQGLVLSVIRREHSPEEDKLPGSGFATLRSNGPGGEWAGRPP